MADRAGQCIASACLLAAMAATGLGVREIAASCVQPLQRACCQILVDQGLVSCIECSVPNPPHEPTKWRCCISPSIDSHQKVTIVGTVGWQPGTVLPSAMCSCTYRPAAGCGTQPSACMWGSSVTTQVAVLGTPLPSFNCP